MNTVTETKDRIFLKRKFKSYYWKNRVLAPSQIEKREFGVGTLEEKIKFRHRSFKSELELQDYLRREAPYYISYSTAYYEFPANQPMPEKNWLGSDLIFDLDMAMDFFDSIKLDKVKEEAMNLIDFLTSDFGFSRDDLDINFSGSKGYHIHLSNDEIKGLGGDERREIVDYVTGSSLNLNCFMEREHADGLVVDRGGRYNKDVVGIIKGPKEGDPAWSGRIYDVTMDFITSDINKLQGMKGIGPKKAGLIVKDKEQNVTSLKRGMWKGFIDFTPMMQQMAIKEHAVKLTGDTDKMVTIDTRRLIRLQDTLHGGTGLRAARIKMKDLEKFDPLKDAIAFSDDTMLINAKSPEFELNDQTFGPFDGKVEVPEYVGIYLLLKGAGNIIS